MKKSKIKEIKAREILNSKGEFTVEVEIETKEGVFCASVPSGTSKGKKEAKEIEASEAVKNIKEIIAPKLKGEKVDNQAKIDDMLIDIDGTENKSQLGANAILACSVAILRAGAAFQNITPWKYISQITEKKPALPKPCILLIEGGLHAGNALDIQEFMIVPEGNSFSERLRTGTEIYLALKKILRKDYGEFATNVGYEGGFAAPLASSSQALNLIMEASKKTDYKNKVKIILDIAATSFWKDGSYRLEGITFTKAGILNFYSDILKKYPIVGLEDPFSEEDIGGFKEITKKVGKKTKIIGDDLLVTNPDRIKTAIEKKYCNAMILKPNQIGTVTETIEAAQLGFRNKWDIFVKHRSGETCDDFIADLAVGLGGGWIMTGAPCRGERTTKYNRLLRIEEELECS